MFFKLSKILTPRVASRASVIRARGVVTIGSTTGFLGLRAVASVPRSIDFRRSCSGVMDRGSFRAGNDLHSYRPVSSSVKRATRDGSNDLGTRRDHIQCSSRDRSDRSDGRLDACIFQANKIDTDARGFNDEGKEISFF